MIEATTAEDVIDIVPEQVEIMRDFIVKSVVAIFKLVESGISRVLTFHIILLCSLLLLGLGWRLGVTPFR